jgi:hypothetical protein
VKGVAAEHALGVGVTPVPVMPGVASVGVVNRAVVHMPPAGVSVMRPGSELNSPLTVPEPMSVLDVAVSLPSPVMSVVETAQGAMVVPPRKCVAVMKSMMMTVAMPKVVVPLMMMMMVVAVVAMMPARLCR